MVRQDGVVDVPRPRADLVGQLDVLGHLRDAAGIGPPGLHAVDVEDVLVRRPDEAEGVVALVQPGEVDLLAEGLVLGAVAVPVDGVVAPVLRAMVSP